MIFFSDGPVQKSKIPEYIRRQNDRYERVIDIFDDIENKKHINNIVERPSGIPTIPYSTEPLKKCMKKYGQYITSIYDECDRELAKYATENNAMAVFGQDSDFLIFSGDWSYWSAKHLNMLHLTTKEYSRIALRSHLALSTEQMFLLATLGLNDFFSYDDLKFFHYQMFNKNKHQKFPCLANFVRSIKNIATNLNDNEILQIISNCMGTNPENHIDTFKQSIRFYDVKRIEPAPAFDIYKENLKESAFGMLTDIDTTISIGYADLRRQDCTRVPEVVLSLYKRLAGVILQHKNDSSITRTFYGKWSHAVPFNAITVHPEYPNGELLFIIIKIK